MQSNERLLKLYESGLPAWAIYMPLYRLPYRPWMRKVGGHSLLVPCDPDPAQCTARAIETRKDTMALSAITRTLLCVKDRGGSL